MKNTIIILAAVITLASCKDFQRGLKGEAPTSEADTTTTKPTIKLHKLDGGTVMVNDLQIFSQGDLYEGETKEFAAPFYIIEHPEGTLLWDAGLPEGLIGQPPYTSPDGNFTVSRKTTAVDQLKELGLAPSDIEYVTFSHTHFDHTGSASQFTESTWLVQKAEYLFVNSDELKKAQPDNYNAIKDLTKIKKFSGDHDVFGDGSVVIKSMPGHTPGHTVLFLDLPETGAVLLSGDLYHFQENRDNKGIPSFNSSVEETKKSFDAFEAFAKANNARVILQHELKDYEATPKLMQ